MQEQEAIAKTLECLARNGDSAKTGYARASMGVPYEAAVGAQWFFDRMQEYRRAEYALQEGDRKPAILLLMSLVDAGRRMGLTDHQLRQGQYPLIPLLDGLQGINTPVEPDDPKPPQRKKSLFDWLFEKLLST